MDTVILNALVLAARELHEMRLAQRHGNPPRNPEMIQEAIEAISKALSHGLVGAEVNHD